MKSKHGLDNIKEDIDFEVIVDAKSGRNIKSEEEKSDEESNDLENHEETHSTKNLNLSDGKIQKDDIADKDK